MRWTRAADSGALCRQCWSSHGVQAAHAPSCGHGGRSHFLRRQRGPCLVHGASGQSRCVQAPPRAASSAYRTSRGARGDLGDVDAVERRQVAGDDPAVLLERVRRPAPFLHGDPLRGEVAEGSSGRRRIAVGQLDRQRSPLRLGVPLPSGPHDTRAVALLSSKRIPAEIRTQFPHARTALTHTPRHGPEGTSELAWMGQQMGRVRTNKAPGLRPGPLTRVFLLAPPTGFEPVSPP